MTAKFLCSAVAHLKLELLAIDECIRSFELMASPPTKWDSFSMARMGGLARAKHLKRSRRCRNRSRCCLGSLASQEAAGGQAQVEHS